MSSLLDHSPPSAQAQLPPLPQSNGQPAAAPPSSPIPSFQLRESISGSEFELLVQTFDDRIVVIVTQNGKMGCMVRTYRPNRYLAIAELIHVDSGLTPPFRASPSTTSGTHLFPAFPLSSTARFHRAHAPARITSRSSAQRHIRQPNRYAHLVGAAGVAGTPAGRCDWSEPRPEARPAGPGRRVWWGARGRGGGAVQGRHGDGGQMAGPLMIRIRQVGFSCWTPTGQRVRKGFTATLTTTL